MEKKIKVKVEMIIETTDFGKEEFRKEIEKLIADIDSNSKLLDFDMFQIGTYAKSKQGEDQERFKMPDPQKIVEIAILFNDGILDEKKLTDMVAFCDFVVDRLYENGDISMPSSKEN